MQSTPLHVCWTCIGHGDDCCSLQRAEAFQSSQQADTEEGQAACDKLGVEVLPTVQFWRNKKKLWEHRGILHLEQDLGEGKPSASQLTPEAC